jgi:hypothetical protein
MDVGEQTTETPVIVEAAVTAKLTAAEEPPPGAGLVTTTG